MSSLDEIKKPIKPYLTEFEQKFKASMKSSVPLLDIITNYIYKRKGKQIRPIMVFLSAGVCGKITDSTFTAASLIELLHTATLIHDDVVDDSNERRGFFSLNALWKNKVAVLVGDYLLSRGLLLSIDQNNFELLRLVSVATREMSEGELLQIEKARRLDIEENIYFDIISKKTAALFTACCATGASSSGAEPEMIAAFASIGRNAGIAFQIKDDLFDYQQGTMTGKPNGIDIKEQKMTLPLIYLLNNTDKSTKRYIINTVKNHHNDPDKVKEVITMVNNSGGIEYAQSKMKDYYDLALSELLTLPASPYRDSFEILLGYIIDRKK